MKIEKCPFPMNAIISINCFENLPAAGKMLLLLTKKNDHRGDCDL